MRGIELEQPRELSASGGKAGGKGAFSLRECYSNQRPLSLCLLLCLSASFSAAWASFVFLYIYNGS